MALSGVTSIDVASNYQLSVEWTATQNTTNNTSTVTAKMYWEADGYGYVNSSVLKSGGVIIAGQTHTFEGNGLADLNNNQKKLISSFTRTLTHNPDGTLDFFVGGYFDVEVTLTNKYYGRITVPNKTFSLNRIPRMSTLSSSPSFTAGSDFMVSITRSSTSFNHVAYIDVQDKQGNWQFIKQVTFAVGDSYKMAGLSVDNQKAIFTALAGRTSATTRTNLYTYSGSTNIGMITYTGKVTAPTPTTMWIGNGQAGSDTKAYVDQTITLAANKYFNGYSQTAQIIVGSFTKTINNAEAGTSWTPNDTEKSSLYSQIGSTGINVKGIVRTTTYYNGVKVGSSIDWDVYFFVRQSSSTPTFSASGLTYSDINAVTSAVTGNPLYIIQNKSSLRVTIPSANKAVGKNGATISTYKVTVNGVAKSVNYSASTLNIDYGTVSSSTSLTATITAIDSRGFSTSVTLPISVVPYTAPMVISTAKRKDGYATDTIITLNGTIAPISVAGVQRNSLQALSGTNSALQYRYKVNAVGSSFSPWYDFTYTPSNASYTASSVTAALDNTQSFTVEIRVTDKLSTTTVTKTVSSGKPLLFIDPNRNSISMNMFPTRSNALELDSSLYLTGNMGYQMEPLTFPSLSKGTNHGNNYLDACFNKDAGGIVRVYGLVDGLVAGDILFTLPAGYRPRGRMIFQVKQGDDSRAARVDVFISGVVQVISIANTTAGNTYYLSLNGIEFPAYN